MRQRGKWVRAPSEACEGAAGLFKGGLNQSAGRGFGGEFGPGGEGEFEVAAALGGGCGCVPTMPAELHGGVVEEFPDIARGGLRGLCGEPCLAIEIVGGGGGQDIAESVPDADEIGAVVEDLGRFPGE